MKTGKKCYVNFSGTLKSNERMAAHWKQFPQEEQLCLARAPSCAALSLPCATPSPAALKPRAATTAGKAGAWGGPTAAFRPESREHSLSGGASSSLGDSCAGVALTRLEALPGSSR